MALVAAAAAAAGAYFLYGKDGSKNRKKVKGWMLKAKGEVLEKMEKLKDINEDIYSQVVDTVAKKYETVKDIDKAELALMATELKRHWSSIKRQLNEGKAKKKTPAKKTAPKKIAKPKAEEK